jgi:hypothetical protein
MHKNGSTAPDHVSGPPGSAILSGRDHWTSCPIFKVSFCKKSFPKAIFFANSIMCFLPFFGFYKLLYFFQGRLRYACLNAKHTEGKTACAGSAIPGGWLEILKRGPFASRRFGNAWCL